MNITVTMNPIYKKHLNNKQSTQIFFGGSSSGKSFFIAQKIVIDCLNGVNWLCCRNVARTIRSSVFNQIVKTISDMGVSKLFRINKTDMVITCLYNGRQILFTGLDDVEKVKSITPAEGVLERIFIEEATEIKEDAYMQLTKRLRGISDKDKYIIMAFNPILQSHWIYKRFFGFWEENKNCYVDENLFILKTTYKDNNMLTAEDRQRLENETDSYYYNVYTLGNWGVLGHVIFQNYRTEDLSELIPSFDKIYNGEDFGWVDPTAIIRVHLDKNQRKIYVFDEFYSQYVSDEELLKVNRRLVGRQYVGCDCASPETIDFLVNHGINAYPVKKGSESIIRGIRWLQGYEIIIDCRCQHFKNEIEQYHWKEDKYGNVLEVPADENNHLLDALRYALEDEILSAEVKAGRRI